MPDAETDTPDAPDDGLTHYEIMHGWSGAVLFAGRFGSLRLCVEAAVIARVNLDGANLDGANLARANLDGANLARANLDGANLVGANLDGAYLVGARLVDARLRYNCKATAAPARRAIRADGYEFVLWPTDKGWRIAAGCRFFSMDDAAKHWSETRPRGTPINDETHDILAMFAAHVARVEAA